VSNWNDMTDDERQQLTVNLGNALTLLADWADDTGLRSVVSDDDVALKFIDENLADFKEAFPAVLGPLFPTP
jgi:hypothetical protein